MINRRSLLYALCAPLLTPTVALAQDTNPSATKQSGFDQLFPEPTGSNGYEEIIRAGERLRAAKADYPPAPEFTLTKKRAYLADPACQDALELVRQGATKLVSLPPATTATAFLPFALIRAVLRLQAVFIAVQFAEGKNDAAVRALRDSLYITTPLKIRSFVGLSIGNSADSAVLTTFARLREVWTPRDCERIIAIINQRLAAPDPVYTAIQAEQAVALESIADWRSDTNALAEAVMQTFTANGIDKSPAEQTSSQDYAKQLSSDSNVRERVLDELSGMVQEHFDRAFAIAKDPTKPMRLTPSPESDSKRHPITVALRSSFLLEAAGTLQHGLENRVAMQLLAVHAAIRRYRWEYDRLPVTLADIPIDEPLRHDPFTGKILLYTPGSDESTYRLASAGALFIDQDNKEYRQALTLPRELPKAP